MLKMYWKSSADSAPAPGVYVPIVWFAGTVKALSGSATLVAKILVSVAMGAG